jgi:hypothetical protein
MFRHRILVAVSAALWSLAGFVADAGAITVNVTALPPPGGLTDCASVPNAVPNDTTDDYPAFKCAVAQIGASSPSLPGQERGTIYVPAGRYILTQTLVITNIHVSIRGEGQQISKLEWNHSGDGILFTSTHATMNYTLSVRSISLLAAAFGAAAIHAAWPAPAEHWSRGIITTLIHDVHIGTKPSESIPAPYWAYGIRLQNSTTAKIDMFNIQGASAVNGIAAIQLDALTATPNTRSISTLIRNGTILKYVRGIEGKIDNEGSHVQDVSMREVSWGIQMTDGLGTTLANNFIEARVTGIELINSSNFSITNNVINQFQTALPFIGIHLDNVASSRVIGNSVWSPTGGASRNGILLKNATSHSVIEGNNTSAMEYGIKIDGTTAVWNVVEANLISSTPFPTTNGGVPGTNYFFNNHW